MVKNQQICLFCDRPLKSLSEAVFSAREDRNICASCIEQFKSFIDNPELVGAKSPSIPKKKLNSRKLREFLDEYVIGQNDAKVALSVGVINHYKRLLYEYEDGIVSKSNILISGPSGSGKSMLLNTVAKYLDVPCITVDVTTLTEAGFVGQNVDSIIHRLIDEAKGNLDAVEHGIVFLDEIDKIALSRVTESVNGKASGVQNALLKMVEGTKISIDTGSDPVEIDTSNILFIAGGAFVGLDEIVKNRLKKKKTIGFQINAHHKEDHEVTTDDYIVFGLIPEFIGRFATRTRTKALGKDDMFAVLKNRKSSVLIDYEFYFDVDSIKLEYTDEFCMHIADKTLRDKTGVRGLRSICDSIMNPHLYLLDEYKKKKVDKIIFHGGCIDRDILPNFEYKPKKSPKKIAAIKS